MFPPARFKRPGWEARWGVEEVERASAVGIATAVMTAEDVNSMEPVSAEVAAVDKSVHPAYEGDVITTLL